MTEYPVNVKAIKLLRLFQSLAVIWKWEMSLFYEFSTCHNLWNYGLL